MQNAPEPGEQADLFAPQHILGLRAQAAPVGIPAEHGQQAVRGRVIFRIADERFARVVMDIGVFSDSVRVAPRGMQADFAIFIPRRRV